ILPLLPSRRDACQTRAPGSDLPMVREQGPRPDPHRVEVAGEGVANGCRSAAPRWPPFAPSRRSDPDGHDPPRPLRTCLAKAAWCADGGLGDEADPDPFEILGHNRPPLTIQPQWLRPADAGPFGGDRSKRIRAFGLAWLVPAE